MQSKRAGATIAIALAVAALATGAVAQERVAEQRDAKADVEGELDLVRVALARSADGRLRGELTLTEAWDTQTLRDAGRGASVCLRVFTARDPESEPPDFLVCATAPKTGDELIGRVLRDRSNGLPRSVDEAVVTRPTARTIYLRFSRTAIGKPASVRFSGETTSFEAGCRQPLGCRDLAPRPPRTGSLALRSMARSQ